jgi:hypothetical protein
VEWKFDGPRCSGGRNIGAVAPQTTARLICPDKTVFNTAKFELNHTITVTYQDSALTPYWSKIFRLRGEITSSPLGKVYRPHPRLIPDQTKLALCKFERQRYKSQKLSRTGWRRWPLLLRKHMRKLVTAAAAQFGHGYFPGADLDAPDPVLWYVEADRFERLGVLLEFQQIFQGADRAVSGHGGRTIDGRGLKTGEG